MDAYAVLSLGLILLLAGAGWFVNGGLGLAGRLGMSGLGVGLTIIAFGTSLPETLVSVFASGDSLGNVAIGNVLGSNVANVLLVLGIAAVICPLPVRGAAVLPHVVISILATTLVALLANIGSPASPDHLALSGSDGAILLFVLLIYMVYMRTQPFQTAPSVARRSDQNTRATVSLLVAGAIAVSLGAHWVVDGTVSVADQLGLSEGSIALSFTAIGTSLPELFVSAVAAFRRHTDMAVGNAIGSNIFNLLWVVGISAQAGELAFSKSSNLDLLVVALVSISLLALVIPRRNKTICRWHGAMMLVAYSIYLIVIVFNR